MVIFNHLLVQSNHYDSNVWLTTKVDRSVKDLTVMHLLMYKLIWFTMEMEKARVDNCMSINITDYNQQK